MTRSRLVKVSKDKKVIFRYHTQYDTKEECKKEQDNLNWYNPDYCYRRFYNKSKDKWEIFWRRRDWNE